LKKRTILLIILIPLAALGFWSYFKKTEPPAVPFAKARRETLVSTLITNGKVEPLEFVSIRVDTPGLVVKLPIKEGQAVSKGTALAELNAPALQSQLDAAQARVEQARADLAVIERGGKKSELAEIESSLERARLDREAAQREHSALRRLEEKHAATRADVEAARGKLRQAELDIQALERRRASLVSGDDRAVADARLREAAADVQLARRRIADTVVRSTIGGVVYSLPIHQGAYLNAGDLVANVGVLGRLRVRVYVDEAELGRVRVGLPVTITWDALPAKKWQGAVEQMPAQIQALGTRQVGEVLCTIENPGHELVPGTNVNAEIRSSVVENALTIPKEALRHDPNGVGIFLLTGGALRWRTVKTGSSSISRVQITEGLAEGNEVALPTDSPLRDGQRVRPIFP
jgi:HlyD family secretion protein